MAYVKINLKIKIEYVNFCMNTHLNVRLKFEDKVKHHLPHVYSYLKKLLKVKTICMDDPFSFEKLF